MRVLIAEFRLPENIPMEYVGPSGEIDVLRYVERGIPNDCRFEDRPDPEPVKFYFGDEVPPGVDLGPPSALLKAGWANRTCGYCGLESFIDTSVPDECKGCRDRFAMAALTGLLAHHGYEREDGEVEKWSYVTADAMMAARLSRRPPPVAEHERFADLPYMQSRYPLDETVGLKRQAGGGSTE